MGGGDPPPTPPPPPPKWCQAVQRSPHPNVRGRKPGTGGGGGWAPPVWERTGGQGGPGAPRPPPSGGRATRGRSVADENIAGSRPTLAVQSGGGAGDPWPLMRAVHSGGRTEAVQRRGRGRVWVRNTRGACDRPQHRAVPRPQQQNAARSGRQHRTDIVDAAKHMAFMPPPPPPSSPNGLTVVQQMTPRVVRAAAGCDESESGMRRVGGGGGHDGSASRHRNQLQPCLPPTVFIALSSVCQIMFSACAVRKAERGRGGGQTCIRRKERVGDGRGSGTQKVVYPKQPKSIFPFGKLRLFPL